MTLKRLLFAVILTVIAPLCAHAQAVGNIQGWCENGNERVITSGLTSTTTEQQSHPRCVVTIYNHGAGLATIYSDIASTPLTNPFTATTNGQWQFYGAAGRYDITMTSGTPQPFPFPVSYLDVPIFGPNGVCTTVLETNGTPNTNQCLLNIVSGSGITVSNTSGVTTISSSGGGGGCTLPGHDTAVLSEHPASTCYDSLDWTWDDTNHNSLWGDGSNTLTGGDFTAETFVLGNNHALTTDSVSESDNILIFGNNSILTDTGTSGSFVADVTMFGDANSTLATNDTTISDVYISGQGGLASSDSATSSEEDIFLNSAGAIQATAATGGGVGVVFSSGYDSLISSVGTGGNTSSIYMQSEHNTVSSNASNTSDLIIAGERSSFTSTGSGSDLDTGVGTGFNLTQASSGGFTLTQGFQFGDGNSITASSSDVSSVYEIGANITISNLSNWLGMGLTANPDIRVFKPDGTHYAAALFPRAFSTYPTCNSTAEGSMASITDSTTNTWGGTITGSGSDHVMGYCDGTNWTVAAK